MSRESIRLVEEVITAETPDTVCVELCASRYQALRQKDRWRDMDIVKVIREKKAFLLLSNLLLASFQKRIAKKMDVTPGAEMLKAIEMADALGAQVWLADRDIRATLSRAWHALGWWSKIKLVYQLLLSMGATEDITEEEIERMKQQDVLEALLSEVGRSMPMLKTILIDERDRYLAAKIRQAPGRKVVAVVGAGHVPGIQAHWNEDSRPLRPGGAAAAGQAGCGHEMGHPREHRGPFRRRVFLRRHGGRHRHDRALEPVHRRAGGPRRGAGPRASGHRSCLRLSSPRSPPCTP